LKITINKVTGFCLVNSAIFKNVSININNVKNIFEDFLILYMQNLKYL